MIGTATILALVVTFASYVGVAYVIRQSRSRKWLDVPNERSSHDHPTPRGGGLVIALICVIAYPLIALYFRTPICWCYFAAGISVAAVSWIDDLYSLPIGWRLLVHFAAAIAVVLGCGYFQSINVPGLFSQNLGPIGIVLTVVWIVWVINAYNFMDGIDGLAGIQAMVASAGWAAIAFALGISGAFYFSLVVFAASAGFLIHNWSPARIFMGDVGSSFLGLTFATMPLLFSSENERSEPCFPFAAILLLWPFLFDSIFSRFRRFGKGKKVWAPHKDHLYQLLVHSGYGHTTVSLVYGGFAVISTLAAVLAVFRPGPLSSTITAGILLITIGFVAAVLWQTRAASTREEVQNASA